MSSTKWDLKAITKSFPGVNALQGVDLSIESGQIHALVGENGSGKSTLIKILAGVHKQDSGQIMRNSHELLFANPNESKKSGIATIYQEFSLVPQLSIAENISLGSFIKKNRFSIDKKLMRNRANEVIGSLGVDLDINTEVGLLSVADQQIVEIAKAVSLDSNLLILDEPTTALSNAEVVRLHEMIRKLATSGKAILYVSHRLEELFDVATKATVLRDGKKVKEVSEKFKIDEIVEAMVGRSVTQLYSKQSNSTSKVVLSVKSLNTLTGVNDVNFDLHEGEILGLAGLVGSKRTEIARAIFGADKSISGEIAINAKLSKQVNPSKSIDNGIGFVPESRKTEGLFFNLNSSANISVAKLKRILSGRFINLKFEENETNKLISAFHISKHANKVDINQLSGGNQQKIVLARWLFAQSHILILDEPTQGIDVGAKQEVYRIINELTANGVAIILISSELPELLGLSDRLAIVKDGQIKDMVPSSTVKEIELIKLISHQITSERV